MEKETVMGFNEEAWLSDEFSALDRKVIMEKERERFQLQIALEDSEEWADDPVACGQYLDFIEAVEESAYEEGNNLYWL